ncbi:MAG: hypothetical protein KC491_14290, partial [Dehalococcoidia bacterium]|nr:hypothetical protein [Dehalococcoidia bacterium]
MISITHIDHIGQVVPELDPQVALLEGLFGMKEASRFEDEAAGHRGVRLEVPGSSAVRWELLSPTRASS